MVLSIVNVRVRSPDARDVLLPQLCRGLRSGHISIQALTFNRMWMVGRCARSAPEGSDTGETAAGTCTGERVLRYVRVLACMHQLMHARSMT